ncbi:hypothetical protein D3C81_1547310 [compost metagenome]
MTLSCRLALNKSAPLLPFFLKRSCKPLKRGNWQPVYCRPWTGMEEHLAKKHRRTSVSRSSPMHCKPGLWHRTETRKRLPALIGRRVRTGAKVIRPFGANSRPIYSRQNGPHRKKKRLSWLGCICANFRSSSRSPISHPAFPTGAPLSG